MKSQLITTRRAFGAYDKRVTLMTSTRKTPFLENNHFVSHRTDLSITETASRLLHSKLMFELLEI